MSETNPIPAWCEPPEDLVGRDEIVESVLAALASGPVTLVGPAGAGATTVGGAVARQLVDSGRVARVAAIPLCGVFTPEDAVHALGLALGAALPGEEGSVQAELERAETALLLDDGDLAPDAAARLLELAHGSPCLVVGRVPVTGATVPVPPLPDEAIATLLPPGAEASAFRGLPLLARLRATPHGDPWEIELPPGVELAADLPVGALPGAIPPELLRPGSNGMPRRAIREVLGLDPLPSAASLAAALRDRLDVLRALATDVLPVGGEPPLPLLRSAARASIDPALAALAAAAATRAAMRRFQASHGLAIAREALDLRGLDDRSVALLRWAEGDALLELGLDAEAHLAHLEAARLFRQGGDDGGRALLARRSAARWAIRGDAPRSRRWLAMARGLGGSPAAAADLLRIAGDLAASTGELVGAAALYDESHSLLQRADTDPRVRVGVQLGRATVEIAAGALRSAEPLLDDAARAAEGDALSEASVALRRAEVALRRGDGTTAHAHLDTARVGYRAAGDRRGLTLVARVRGDLAALAGDRAEAARRYREAAEGCLRARDLAGLRRVVRRALSVEREGRPGPHVDELAEQLDLVEVLARVRVDGG